MPTNDTSPWPASRTRTRQNRPGAAPDARRPCRTPGIRAGTAPVPPGAYRRPPVLIGSLTMMSPLRILMLYPQPGLVQVQAL